MTHNIQCMRYITRTRKRMTWSHSYIHSWSGDRDKVKAPHCNYLKCSSCVPIIHISCLLADRKTRAVIYSMIKKSRCAVDLKPSFCLEFVYSTEKYKQQFIADIITDVLPTHAVDVANLIRYFSCSLAWNLHSLLIDKYCTRTVWPPCTSLRSWRSSGLELLCSIRENQIWNSAADWDVSWLHAVPSVK